MPFWPWLLRIFAAFLLDPEKIIKWAICILLIPVALLVLLFAGPVVAYERIPLAKPSQVQLYVEAAREVSESTRTACDEKGLTVDWQPLLAIDAVLLRQDFSLASKWRAVNLARRFVEQTGTRTCIVGYDRHGKPIEKTVPVYRLRNLDEVLDELRLDAGQRAKVADYLTLDLNLLRDVGPGVPPGWLPVEKSFRWPVPGVYFVTSGFGPRIDPVEGIDGFHTGIDIGASMGTPVVAAADGLVTTAGWAGNYGQAVFIRHNNNLETRYCHLSGIAARRGQEVNAGEVIGYVGSTGKSTGPHLHFEIRRGNRPTNPVDYY
ncbi:MAG: hypothetical protein PWP65_954 [Clostridia bacterium]|nr:hypothetical protein [Clostridia bacterium]